MGTNCLKENTRQNRNHSKGTFVPEKIKTEQRVPFTRNKKGTSCSCLRQKEPVFPISDIVVPRTDFGLKTSSYWCLLSLFLKQLEEQSSKIRGTVAFQESHYFLRRINYNHDLKTC